MFATARSVLSQEAALLTGKAPVDSEEAARMLTGIPRKHMFR